MVERCCLGFIYLIHFIKERTPQNQTARNLAFCVMHGKRAAPSGVIQGVASCSKGNRFDLIPDLERFGNGIILIVIDYMTRFG